MPDLAASYSGPRHGWRGPGRGACSLGGEERPGGPSGSSPNPWPAGHQPDGAGNLRPVRRLNCPAARMQRRQTPARGPVQGDWLESLMVTPGPREAVAISPDDQPAGRRTIRAPRHRRPLQPPSITDTGTGEICVVVLITQRWQGKRSFVPARRHLCVSVCPLARVRWWTAAGVR
jgi:hypothetical protein